MISKFYAGFGHDDTPDDIMHIMQNFGTMAESLGWTLRTGGHGPAARAFETGVKHYLNKEVFLPWGAYQGNKSHRTKPRALGSQIMNDIQPGFDDLSDGAKKFHLANVQIILGDHFETPVRFVLCWSPANTSEGVYGSAMRLAEQRGIPVFNFSDPNIDEDGLARILQE